MVRVVMAGYLRERNGERSTTRAGTNYRILDPLRGTNGGNIKDGLRRIKEDHDRMTCLIVFILLTVSSHSRTGFESMVTPAPA